MSKGSRRRPATVEEAEVSRRWQQAFGSISRGKKPKRPARRIVNEYVFEPYNPGKIGPGGIFPDGSK